MTVKELIDHLKGFPAKAEVHLSIYGCGTTTTYPYEAHRIQLRKGIVVIEAEDN